MNIDNIIIFVNDEDKTQDIVECYQVENDKIEVKLNNGESNIYDNSQVKWSTKYTPIELDNVVIYENEVEITNILKAIVFDEFDKIRIIFNNGSSKLYSRDQLVIKDNGLDEPIVENNFTYFKEISKQLDICNNCDGVSRIFEDISVINPNSALVSYLNPKSMEVAETVDFAIYPFGFELGQKEAVEKALTNKISIIESASVKERTEAILNIAATAVIKGENVAIVTKDNFSSLKYLEVLKKSDVDFIVNHLKENETSDFENSCENWLRYFGNILKSGDMSKKKSALVNFQKKLVEQLENKAKIEILEIESAALFTENAKLEKILESEKVAIPDSMLKFTIDKLLAFKEEYSSAIKKQGHISFFRKIMYIFKYNIIDFSFYNIRPEILKKALDEIYNNLKIDEIDEEIKLLKINLDKSKINSEIEKVKEKSIEVLKIGLYERFNNIEEMNNSQEEGDNDIIKEKRNYPILTSDIDFFINSINSNKIFDYVILDEASDMDIITGALAFARGKNIIIIDDLNERKKEFEAIIAEGFVEIFDRYEVNPGYKYLDNSLILSLNQLFKEVPKAVLTKSTNGIK